MVRRDELSRAMIQHALEIYFHHAYGGDPKRIKGLDDAASDDVFAGFCDESRPAEAGHPRLERFTLRLGNRLYPYMKLVLQEHVIAGQFCFGVDTHDQMEIRPDLPDYEAFMRLRRHNFELKRRIEEALSEAGLPTMRSIRDQAFLAPQRARTQRDRPLIFVVDDETDEAQALEAMLRREGFDVVLAFDGREALDRMPFLDPALVILDYEMPEIDGLTVIRELRRDPRTRDLPILLTTACRVLQNEGPKADGFLPKPFASGELMTLVHTLLAPR